MDVWDADFSTLELMPIKESINSSERTVFNGFQLFQKNMTALIPCPEKKS